MALLKNLMQQNEPLKAGGLQRPAKGSHRHVNGNTLAAVPGACFSIRTVLFLAIIAFQLLTPEAARSADADRAPDGWGEIKFGMSLQEVVAILGKRARHINARPESLEAPPFQSLGEARDYAAGLLEAVKADPTKYDKPVVAAAKLIAKSAKPRLWVFGDRRLNGVYESGGPELFVVVTIPKGDRYESGGNPADRTSQSFIEDIQASTKALAKARATDGLTDYENKDEMSIDRPEQLVVTGAEEYGLPFIPSVLMTPRFSGVLLSCGDYNQEKPVATAARYESFCKMLAKKYGPPDLSTITKGVRKREWQFPDALVRAYYREEVTYTPQHRRGEGTVMGANHRNIISLLISEATLQEDASELPFGLDLKKGGRMVSSNGRYQLVLHHDGNMTLVTEAKEVLWSSNTTGLEAFRLCIDDVSRGLCLQDRDGKVLWTLPTKSYEIRGDRLIVQDDGNLVFYDGTVPSWATNTNRNP